MNLRLLTPFLLVATATFAADAPKLPSIFAEPIAKKKEMLFSYDIEWAELGIAWAIVVPTFSLVNGTLKGTQCMRSHCPQWMGELS